MGNIVLPVKTKIAAWWIRLFALILLAYAAYSIVSGYGEGYRKSGDNCATTCNENGTCYDYCEMDQRSAVPFVSFLVSCVMGLLTFVLSKKLFAGKKWAWFGCVGTMLFLSIWPLFLVYFYLREGALFDWSSDFLFLFLFFVFIGVNFITALLLLNDKKAFFRVAR